jgi:hypothetical protein
MMKKIFLVFISIVLLTAIVSAVDDYPPPSDGMGTLRVNLLCGHNMASKELIISGEGNYSIEQIGTNGIFEKRVIPGIYHVWLPYENSDRLEYKTERVYSTYETRITFIGQAVTTFHHLKWWNK